MVDNALERLPKKYQEKIQDILVDDGCYWINLKEGWCIDNEEEHLFTATSIKSILFDMSENVRPCNCPDCRASKNCIGNNNWPLKKSRKLNHAFNATTFWNNRTMHPITILVPEAKTKTENYQG